MNEHSGGELSLYLRIVLPVIGLPDVDLGEQEVKKQHLRQILPTCCIRPYKLLRNTSLYLFSVTTYNVDTKPRHTSRPDGPPVPPVKRQLSPTVAV